jgi:hypothetical protein
VTALNAAFAPLTASIIRGIELGEMRNFPFYARNLFAAFGSDTSGAVTLASPFQVISFSASEEAQVIILLKAFIAANPTYFFSGPYFAYRPEFPDPNQSVIGFLFFNVAGSTASSNWGGGGGTCVFGLPLPYAAAHVIAAVDNGNTLILTGTPLLTINPGLAAGFGCAIKGDFTYDGTATVTDVREVGSLHPWCALVQTGTNTYDLVGNKV